MDAVMNMQLAYAGPHPYTLGLAVEGAAGPGAKRGLEVDRGGVEDVEGKCKEGLNRAAEEGLHQGAC